jgi:hypothetical protein
VRGKEGVVTADTQKRERERERERKDSNQTWDGAAETGAVPIGWFEEPEAAGDFRARAVVLEMLAEDGKGLCGWEMSGEEGRWGRGERQGIGEAER